MKGAKYTNRGYLAIKQTSKCEYLEKSHHMNPKIWLYSTCKKTKNGVQSQNNSYQKQQTPKLQNKALIDINKFWMDSTKNITKWDHSKCFGVMLHLNVQYFKSLSSPTSSGL